MTFDFQKVEKSHKWCYPNGPLLCMLCPSTMQFLQPDDISHPHPKAKNKLQLNLLYRLSSSTTQYFQPKKLSHPKAKKHVQLNLLSTLCSSTKQLLHLKSHPNTEIHLKEGRLFAREDLK